MIPERIRRLSAVWFADIVGYSRLSAADEDAALALVAELQRAAHEVVDAHGGRVVKFVGDAVLAVFESVDGALRAALALQEAFTASEAARTRGSTLRIGLHMGEVTEAEDGDIYGDGVNVASRLQSKARPGQLLVSRAVAETVRGRGGYVVRRFPVWHPLKGLGLMRVFVVESQVSGEAPPRRISTSRAAAVGLAAALLGFFTLMIGVAMAGGEGGSPAAGAPEAAGPEATEIRNGTVRLNLGVEHYFAGELGAAVEALESFASPPLRAHPNAQRALRFLARAHLASGRPDRARATLARMVESEPPMALLIPSAEEDALLALYYDVRRDARLEQAAVRPRGPVEEVVVFDLEVVRDSADALAGELGPSVAQMLVSELEEAGVPTGYFWALMVGFSGEGAYRRFDRDADAGDGEAASHALLGRVILHGGQVTVSAQVYDVATGALHADELVTGAWPDDLFGLVEELGATVAGRLGSPLPSN